VFDPLITARSEQFFRIQLRRSSKFSTPFERHVRLLIVVMPILSAGVVSREPLFVTRGERRFFGTNADEVCHFGLFEIAPRNEWCERA
jgi:hypothetical protein